MPIENTLNFDDVFLRDVTVAFIQQLNKRIYWYNIWENEKRKIEIPFYYSLTGDDRFLLDAFVDDIAGQRIEMNYDKVPRGIVTLETTSIRSNELTNPNVRVSRYVEENAELKRVVSKIRSLPLTLGFEIKIKVASEIDLFKCQQSLWNLVYQYQYFDFDHNFVRIDGFFKFPDEFQTKFAREINMQSEIYPEQTFRLDVQTFYPMFGEIERIPPIKRVQWQQNFWRLNGSGAENISEPKNQYPPSSEERSGQNRNDRLHNPND